MENSVGIVGSSLDFTLVFSSLDFTLVFSSLDFTLVWVGFSMIWKYDDFIVLDWVDIISKMK